MLSRNLKRHLAEVVEAACNGKRACVFFMVNFDRLNIRLGRQAVCEELFLADLRHNVLQRGLVKTQNDKAIERNLVRKLNKCALDIFKVPVTIKVVRFKRRQNGYRRRNGQERTVKFVRFNDNKISFTETSVRSAESA